jgi:hypothetical protein
MALAPRLVTVRRPRDLGITAASIATSYAYMPT